MNYLKPLDFYKRYGIRDLMMFNTPIPRLLKDLPTDVVVHSLDMGEEITVDLNTPFTSTTGRRVLVNFVRDPLGFNHAVGRKTPVLNTAISKFFQKNTKTLRLTNIANIPSDRQVVVNAYNVIPQLFRYSQTAKITPFYQWLDTYSAIWANASKQAQESNRHHFVFFPIPKELIAKSKLEAFAKSNQETMMRFLTDTTKYALLDLWRWLGKESRPLSALSMLREEDLPKMNFVFQLRTGRVIVLNLGYLYSFMRGNPNLTPMRRVRQVSENQLANFVLTFFIRLSRMDMLSDEEQQGLEEGQPDPELEVPDNTVASSEPHATDTSGVTDATGGNKGFEKSFKKGVIEQKEKASEMAPQEKSLEDINREIEEELQALEVLEAARDKKRDQEEATASVFGEDEYDPEAGPSRDEVLASIFKPKTHQEKAQEYLDNAAAEGIIDARKYKAAVEILKKQELMDDPYGSGEPLLQAAIVKPEHQTFKPHDVEKTADIRVQDPSMVQSPVEALDKQYIRECMKRDTLAAFLHAQTAGVLVADIDTTIHHGIGGSIEEHALTLKPISGDSSVIRIRKPIVEEDGTFLSNGVRYHKRKMRIDVPLRATNPGRVCISSHIGKIPITRGAKKSQNELEMVIKRLNLASLGGVESIPKVFTANVLNPQLEAPFVFNALAEHFKGFQIKHPIFGTLSFDFEHDEKLNDQQRVCGKTDKGYPIVVNDNDEFSVITPKGPQPIGTIFELTGLDRTKAPVEPALMKVLGQQVPAGIMMGRSLGFRGMVKALGCTYRMEDASRRVALEPHEYEVRFKDKKFIFDRNDKQAALMMGGLLMAEKQLKMFSVKDFEKKDVYNILLETLGMSPSVPRELDLVESSWIDPCTQRVLESQGQPSTFMGVLLSGTKLLTSYSAPEVQDFNHQRLWGYESFAGHIHRALYKAIRQQRNKNYSGRAKVNMSSFEVWASIREDRSIKTTEDINPIQNLKMHESVTFVGEGGRMKEAFVKQDRAFTLGDVNVIGEASVDSGDVGINIFTSANPSLKDVTGVRSDQPVLNHAAKYFSTSDLLAAGSQHDDGKRRGFTSIQNAHTIACKGYRPSYLQTGYEAIVGQRNDKMFCFTASRPGKVVQVTDKAIKIQYDDGEIETGMVGRVYGSAEGSTYPHDLVTNLKEGDKFRKGDAITYNKGFFAPDAHDPKRVTFMMSLPANIMYREDPRTHEDSCSISEELGDRLETSTTKVKAYVVKFNDTLHNVATQGKPVNPGDILMAIEAAVTGGTGGFDAESASKLSNMGKQIPLSSYTGILDRIEVYYHGEKSDMHPSLKALADRSDRFFTEQSRDMEKPKVNGRVDGDWSVKGKPLALGEAEVRFLITVNFNMNPGDKLVFANQLKTTVGEIMRYQLVTESGRKIDGEFSGRAAIKRIVNSHGLQGTTTGNMMALNQLFVKTFKGS